MSSNKGRDWLLSLGALFIVGVGCAADELPQRSDESKTPLPAGVGSPSPVPGGGVAGTRALGPGAGTGTGSFAGTGVAPAPAAGSGSAGVGTIPVAMAAAGVGGPIVAGTGAKEPTPAGTGGMTTIPTGEGPALPAATGECPQLQDGTIMAAGHKGVVISAGSGKGGALVFYWHGTAQSPAEATFQIPGAVRTEILSGGGIIAAFNGNQSSGKGMDCSGTMAHNSADFEAADLIAACAVKNNGIDPRRIYTTGCSAGGLQSGCMAQMRSSYLAASAPNSGGVVFPAGWQDMHSPAIFTMHGGASDMVFVTFSETSASLDKAAKSHGSFVVNCDHGGSHCGAPAALQTAAWQFMKDHPFGFGTSPWASGIPAGVPAYCKVY